jgi:exonuclease SbcC
MVPVGPSVHLHRVGGGETTPAATGVIEVRNQIQDLVGLSASQFQRVVLLPQAKVTEFLLATSTDREELLEQLFDGRLFDEVVERLKARKDEAAQSIGSIDQRLRSLLDSTARELRTAEELLVPTSGEPNEPVDASDSEHGQPEELPDDEAQPDAVPEPGELDPESLRERLASARVALDQLRQDSEAASTVARDLAGQLAEAQQLVERFDQALTVGAKLDDQRDREPAIAEAASLAEASALARPVVEAASTLKSAQQHQVAARRVEEQAMAAAHDHLIALGVEESRPEPRGLRDELTRLTADHRDIVDRLGAVQTLRASVRDLEQQLEDFQRKIEAQDGLVQESDAAIKDLDRRIAEMSANPIDAEQLAHQTAQANAALKARRELAETERAGTRAADERDEEDRRHADLLGRYVATQIPQLASRLSPGEACPVCGSIDHPSPASASDDEQVTLEQVDAAAERRGRAERTLAGVAARATELRRLLGDQASASEAELDAAVRQAQQAEAVADQARSELQRLTADRGHTQIRRDEARTAAAELQGGRARAEQELAGQSVHLRSAEGEAAGIDAAIVAARTGHLEALQQLMDPLDLAVNARSEADGAVRLALQNADASLRASPFDSTEDAANAVLDPEEETRRLNALAAIRQQIQELGGALKALTELGIPEVRPVIEEQQAASSEATSLADSLGRRLTMVEAAMQRSEDHLSDYTREVEESGSAREQHELLARAHEICHKGGKLRCSLTRWVLAQELERVTIAANVHLQSMTNDRYALRVKREVSDARTAHGLELEVFDAETGQARSTSSLSGGEQFQASLALALGLADVVSQGGVGSGHRFEALFVDEGFGALDPDALDDAIETLQSLHATGRTIGVITHVEAMKERLHVGIQVERRPDGRGSRLTVLP